jgi:hypothetical protein
MDSGEKRKTRAQLAYVANPILEGYTAIITAINTAITAKDKISPCTFPKSRPREKIIHPSDHAQHSSARNIPCRKPRS